MDQTERHALAQELEVMQEHILDLMAEAKDLVAGSPIERHALAYWIGNIERAAGGSIDSRWEQTIGDGVDELLNGDFDEDEDLNDITESQQIALDSAGER